MSGDVQPRKRKDKKRKKDELSVEEPKGTSAIFGEGDVFLHSQHDHGTGGHWCAKIIFFSLLAVLVTLIALIIMENRGLSELEANQIESRYSGVLEGWLEEGSDDDHHDVHTLELKHHDEDEEENPMSEIQDHHSDEAVEEVQEKQQQPYFFMSYFGSNNDNANGDDDDDLDEDEDDEDRDDEDNDDNQISYENDLDENDMDEGFYEAIYNRQNNGDDDDEEDNINDKSNRYSEEIDDQDDDDENNDDQDDDNNDEDDYNKDENDDNEDEDDDEKDKKRQERFFTDDQDDDDGNNDDLDDNNNDEDDGDKDENDDDEDKDDDEKDEDEKRQTRFITDNQDDDDLEFSNDDKYKDDHGDGDDEEDGDDHDDDDDEHIQVEKIEREVNDDEPISVELPTLPEEDDENDKDDDDDDNTKEDDDDDNQEDDDFLDNDVDEELPIVEHITAPSGKPFQEVDDDDSTEQTPVDTLADEEEYEKRQEEIRKEQEEASHIWLKVGVGCALVVATHAVVRRALSTGNESENETQSREETPLSDRRMTLVPEQATPAPQRTQERPRKVIQEEISKHIPAIIQSAPTPRQMSLNDELEDEETPLKEESPSSNIEIETVDKELYSDEDEEMVEEEEKEEVDGSEADEELLDDVEVIEDEQIEEEQIDEEDEDDISDVDDAELLTRLEAKYGKLPENKNKEGGKSVEDDLWPDEPSDSFWKQELDRAEDDFRQGRFESALSRVGATELGSSSRARWLQAATLDAQAERKRDNTLLTRAITVYRSLLLDFNEKLSDDRLLQITNRTINRMFFRGAYLSADPIYRLLIRRFPNEIGYRNNMTISFLMANRADLAANVLNETLKIWPEDPIALVHYAFVLKTHYNKLEESVELFKKALKDVNSPASEPRFYYHYGDALLLLGRLDEADKVHKRGAQLGHFPSPMQRSLYNVDRLKSRPWWNIAETPYVNLANKLERNWKTILKEGVSAKQLYEEEREGLRERGDWSQMDLFARGSEVSGRCDRAPVTCETVRSEKAAVTCRRGQIKFSAIRPGTHVRAHTGPTNCRLRMHLALSNTTGTYMRVGTETRQWELGKVWLFDDSFEHEVWHNGTGTRLVLIVDVWHPDLTPQERRQLPAI